MKSVLLLLIVSVVVLGTPMSALGDTQPASAQTAQTASADVASGAGMQVAITKIHASVDVAIELSFRPVQVAMKMVGKPMDTALMIVKSQRHAIQVMKPRTMVALNLICEF